MALTSFDPRQPRVSCGPTKILYGYNEANSSTFKAGSPVYVNAGAVTASVGGTTPVMGLALKDATNVTSGNVEIPIQIFEPHTEILIQVSGGGTLEAANTTCKPGVAYDMIAEGTDGFAVLDSADTTNPVLVFVEPVRDVNGDVTYWAKCRPYYLENQSSAG